MSALLKLGVWLGATRTRAIITMSVVAGMIAIAG